MKSIKIAALFLLCIIQSCAKETNYLPSNITFKGNLNDSVKSSSNLNVGVKALLYTYKEKTESAENITKEILLISNGFGGMPSTLAIFLQNGIYDFYSISLNDNSNLVLNQNFKLPAENGKDYIWASKEQQNIIEDRIIDFAYKHISTKINVVVEFPDSFKNVHINYIKYTLPNCSSSFINLKKGEITPANTVLPLSVIPGIENSRTFIAIPCIAQKQIELSINSTIEGENINNVIYKSNIDESFKAGINYIVNLNIESLFNSFITLSYAQWENNSNIIIY